jgi:hypothetical protein
MLVYILASNSSGLNTISPTSTIDLRSPSLNSSPLLYRNPRLERIVHAKQSKSQLSLNSMELIDQDMEILVSYLLRNDTVRLESNSS